MVKFSIIIPVFNAEKYLKECLDSVLNQTFGDFEVICINNGSTDNSQAILDSYKSNDGRIRTYSQEKGGVSAARNYGIELAQGEYIHFLDSDDTLQKNALGLVDEFFDRHKDVNVVSIPFYYFNKRNHVLNYKFNQTGGSDTVVDLIENPEYIQTSTNCFIRSDEIADLRFDTNLNFDEGLVFINRVLLSSKKLGLVKGTRYCYRTNNENALSVIAKNKKEFYGYRLKCLKDLIDFSIEKEGKLVEFIKYAIAFSFYPIKDIDSFPDDMTRDEINGFWQDAFDVLSHVDDDVLLQAPFLSSKKVNYFRDFMFYMKNRKEFHIEKDEDNLTCLKTGDYTINRLEKHRIFFDIIELKEGVLNLSGNFVSSCKKDVLSVEAVKVHDGKKEVFKGKYVEYPRTPRETIRILGIDWRFDYDFEFKIPIDKKGDTKINFRMIYEENGEKAVMQNNITFRKFAEISKFSHYYIRNSQILAVINKTINIIPYSFSKALRFEISSIKAILSSGKKYALSSTFYRMLYLACLPVMGNREVYLFMDRRDNTGDNGEHLFRYATTQDDGILKYFAVEKECNEYEKLKKEYGGRILAFGSFKHKFIYMFTDKLISSQGYKRHINPFADNDLSLVQGISSPPVYFLQHGVGKYNMTNWLRKYDINFSLLLTVSDLDYRAFVENYNYDEEIIQELGFPRYDNLTNDNLKKEIVIIPTWRKELRTDDDLIHSEYYMRWNNLLNNEKLIDYANEKGYEIVYKPHPNSLKFLELFNTDNVHVDNERRFHDILCESALMITDYSSVNFDFAFLKKPIIYYQYGDDYHFQGDSLIDEDASTFGEIIKDEDVLIEKIIEYIDNDCRMEDRFVDKVERFFKFNDRNNSKRVYDWITKH